jgi:hypothetical protein
MLVAVDNWLGWLSCCRAGERARVARAIKTDFKRRIEFAGPIRGRAGIAALPRNGDE